MILESPLLTYSLCDPFLCGLASPIKPTPSSRESPDVCPSPFRRGIALFALRAFAGAGHYPLSSPAFCPSPTHKREPSSKLQFPLLGSLFFSHFSHFYDFSCNLCDDSSRIRLWFGILCPYLHEFVGSLHTVTLGIPSKFIVSTLAQSLSHRPLFSVYTA